MLVGAPSERKDLNNNLSFAEIAGRVHHISGSANGRATSRFHEKGEGLEPSPTEIKSTVQDKRVTHMPALYSGLSRTRQYKTKG